MASLDELYRDFQARSESYGWARPIDLDAMHGRVHPRIERVLRRRALAVALHTDEIFSKIQKATGVYQDTALRLYLLLTCIEIIGEMYRGDSFYPFETWLKINKGAVAKERKGILDQQFSERGGDIDTSERLLEAVGTIHRRYKDIYGFATHFYVFFQECLDSSVRTWIAQHCWVYEDNPLTPWAALHLVEPGYSYTRTPELRRLTDSRRKWDRLDIDRRIRKIARCCQLIRNDYTHGLIATPAPQDKRSWFEDNDKQTLAAIEAGKIVLAPEEEFREWQKLAQGSGTMFGVNTVTHEGQFVARALDLDGEDYEQWLKKVCESCRRPFDHGDTVFIWTHNQALATREKPLTRHLEEWIDNGLKNIVSKGCT
jgi:hypothetical protein